ncbi:MAG: hypothetical protein ACLVJN_08555 [Streptococcus parasanguinis]
MWDFDAETVVNRLLNELKREGVLDIRQQKIVILDNERIEEFIGRELFPRWQQKHNQKEKEEKLQDV